MSTKLASRKAQESLSLTLALVVKSGKYALGTNQAIKSIRDGKAKLVLIAQNCPGLVRSQIEYLCMMSHVNVHTYSASSRELGTAVGKQFNVSVMTILDPGDADLTAVTGP